MKAIISDIHGNLEALLAVLQDIETQQLKEIYCLGDLVGYGPNPAECVDLAMGWPLVLLGNHDEAVVKEALGFNPAARDAVEWHRSQLRPGLFSPRSKKNRWDFLKNRPTIHEEGDVMYVHASPRDHTMEYILRTDCEDLVDGASEKIRDIFTKIKRLCFVGHTHEPGIINEEGEFLSPGDVGGRFVFPEGKKFIVNVGSVGQPRDGDPRGCYATFDGQAVAYRRVTYTVEKTIDKIHRIASLDRRIGDRLALGR